jgi:hypothetical protein
MKALISPSESVTYIKFETTTDPETNEEITTPIYGGVITNGARIAEVAETQFDVGGDLYWVDCNSSVTANDYYYDTSDNTIKAKSDF